MQAQSNKAYEDLEARSKGVFFLFEKMKLSGNRLKMGNGSVRKFKSAKKRANFERVAQAVKHGWKKGSLGRKKK
jgi:hypothetical protein